MAKKSKIVREHKLIKKVQDALKEEIKEKRNRKNEVLQDHSIGPRVQHQKERRRQKQVQQTR